MTKWKGRVSRVGLALGFGVIGLVSCSKDEPPPAPPPPPRPHASAAPPVVKVERSLLAVFAPLPAAPDWKSSPPAKAKVELGRMLFHDKRLSMNQDQSCSTCHLLSTFGVDGKAFSIGESEKPAERNTPSVYDSAIAATQFWDGRVETLEAALQAILDDPNLMGAPGNARIETTFRSIPAYEDAFKGAFPDGEEPVTAANVVNALGAFIRTLVTPSKWDRFLGGEDKALTNEEKSGFLKFVETGCTQCHQGPLVGGTMSQLLGKVKPWPNLADKGKSRTTKSPSDDMWFRVSPLRNVSRTAPYFHDASAKTLAEAVKTMAAHQLGKDLSDDDVKSIDTWLETLSADSSTLETALPELPQSTLKTPKPPRPPKK